MTPVLLTSSSFPSHHLLHNDPKVGLIVGSTGSGKSIAIERMAAVVSAGFNRDFTYIAGEGDLDVVRHNIAKYGGNVSRIRFYTPETFVTNRPKWTPAGVVFVDTGDGNLHTLREIAKEASCLVLGTMTLRKGVSIDTLRDEIDLGWYMTRKREMRYLKQDENWPYCGPYNMRHWKEDRPERPWVNT